MFMKNPQIVDPIRHINSLCMSNIWLGQLMWPKLRELGWSQAELARRLRRSPTHVGNLLNDIAPGTKSGKRERVSLNDCDRVADILGLPRELARRAGGWFVDDKPVLDLKASRLQGYFIQLPDPAQDDAIAIVEVLWRRHGQPAEPPKGVTEPVIPDPEAGFEVGIVEPEPRPQRKKVKAR